MPFLQPGTSGNIPRRGSFYNPPLLPTVPELMNNILQMEEELRAEGQLPMKAA